MGGRTNAVKLHHEVETDERIGYIDICSLYPMTLKNDEFPVGIPEVIIDPDSTDVSQFFGLVQARVRPPRKLYHPCLPMRANSKLLFPLCAKCARNLSKTPCNCLEEDRDLVGTWTTIDLEDAVKVGYRVLRIFEVYHFKERARYSREEEGSGLFTDYVNLFLKGKAEASGWPANDMTGEEKDRCIQDFFDSEGVRLEKDNVKFNSGHRATNNLLLNSFWGKFGEQNNHRVHKIVSKPEEVFGLLTNPSIEIKNFHIISEDRCLFEYEHVKGFLPEMPHVNIFIACFTTANARRRLYDVLLNLDRRVLYFDTDSCIYLYNSDPDEYHPTMGSHLGQWTNELKPGEYITQFVSSGPKSYAFVTNFNNQTVKLKGFTLNHENSSKLNFESLKRLVLFWGDPDRNPLPPDEDPHIMARYNKICRRKYAFQLFNREELKRFRVTYCKRQLIPGTFDTLPYGY